MESQSLSHREMYHRHLANIHNQKEKKNFESLNKIYDKDRESKQFQMKQEEKGLRDSLTRLKHEQSIHNQERHAANTAKQSSKSGSNHGGSRGGLKHESMKHSGMLTGTAIGVKPVDSEDEIIQSVYTASEMTKQTAWQPTSKSGGTGTTPRKQQAASFHNTGAGRYHEYKKFMGSSGMSGARSHHAGVKHQSHDMQQVSSGRLSPKAFKASTKRSSIVNMAHKHNVNLTSLEHYYNILAENEHKLMEHDSDFKVGHSPMGTLHRSNRRKILALEALLKQLPSQKQQPVEMDPLEVLNCSYLRLTPQNIDDLEKRCYQMGVDPGLHCHLTPEQVEDLIEDSSHNPAMHSQHQEVMRALQAKRHMALTRDFPATSGGRSHNPHPPSGSIKK